MTGSIMKVESLAQQVLFSTCKIFNLDKAGQPQSVGTGFFYETSDQPEVASRPVIVTNKHVVEGAHGFVIRLIRGDASAREIKLGDYYDATFPLGADKLEWIGHPDPAVDVAAVFFGPILTSPGVPPIFYRTLDQRMMPTPEIALELDAIEDLTFIGYPDGHADQLHHTPIVRRAISATPVTLPFSGRPTFLMDGSVFGGSSGSPVLVINKHMYQAGGRLLLGQQRVLLVGIVAETIHRQRALPLVARTQPHTILAQEINLGVAFSWSTISETAKALCDAYGIGSPSPLPPSKTASDSSADCPA